MLYLQASETNTHQSEGMPHPVADNTRELPDARKERSARPAPLAGREIHDPHLRRVHDLRLPVLLGTMPSSTLAQVSASIARSIGPHTLPVATVQLGALFHSIGTGHTCSVSSTTLAVSISSTHSRMGSSFTKSRNVRDDVTIDSIECGIWAAEFATHQQVSLIDLIHILADVERPDLRVPSDSQLLAELPLVVAVYSRKLCPSLQSMVERSARRCASDKEYWALSHLHCPRHLVELLTQLLAVSTPWSVEVDNVNNIRIFAHIPVPVHRADGAVRVRI
jgi:hypothetical protein